MDFTTEQFKAFILEKAKQSGEILEEELDAIAGGANWEVMKPIVIEHVIIQEVTRWISNHT